MRNSTVERQEQVVGTMMHRRKACLLRLVNRVRDQLTALMYIFHCNGLGVERHVGAFDVIYESLYILTGNTPIVIQCRNECKRKNLLQNTFPCGDWEYKVVLWGSAKTCGLLPI